MRFGVSWVGFGGTDWHGLGGERWEAGGGRSGKGVVMRGIGRHGCGLVCLGFVVLLRRRSIANWH